MNRRHTKLSTLALVTLLLIMLTASASNARITFAAPRDTGYTIDWYTIDGGGILNITGGTYSMSGTIGQPDAGALNGTGYTLNGGFWQNIANLMNQYQQFHLPFISK